MLPSWKDLNVGDKLKCLNMYIMPGAPTKGQICVISHFHHDMYGYRDGAYITDITGNIKYGWFSLPENWELVTDYQVVCDSKPKEKIDWFRLNKEMSGY